VIRHFAGPECDVVVLSRRAAEIPGARVVQWDGATLGDWAREFDGVDAVLNLAGRSVNCRYNRANLDEMMRSRVDSTRLVGQAIQGARRPPKVWLQSATATIYAHRFDAPNDELTGALGGGEPGSSPTWDASIEIAKAWERTLDEAETPNTRKVALRSAMTMSNDPGSVFDVFCRLARRGLFGTLGDGRQFVSWIHEDDYCGAMRFLIEHEELSGPVNLCSPNPLPQAEFAVELRAALGVRFGLPAAKWMIELGCWAMRTESELVLKSRRVVPTRLLDAGYEFRFATWREACWNLASRRRDAAQDSP